VASVACSDEDASSEILAKIYKHNIWAENILV
jgi:hypothetical protein